MNPIPSRARTGRRSAAQHAISRSRRSRAGFSLAELLGVIVILGLIGTTAVISWQALLPGAQVNKAIRELSEVIASARSESISRNAQFEIYYDLDKEHYWVRTPFKMGGGLAVADDDRAIMDEVHLDNVGLAIASVTIDEEVYNEGPVFVRFDPLGASSAHTVVLYHEMFDSTYTIEVLPLTGQIRMHEGLYEREQPREGDFD